MAVFIALFFQVLFVFFAMAINVGLVIHDKINLQNSVDIAAYYGAVKQAEILNQIAHINYQMRQNYKLFVWRYRVLGTLVLTGNPLRPPSALNPSPDGPQPLNSNFQFALCVSGDYWKEFHDPDPNARGYCKNIYSPIPNIPPLGSGGGIVPGMGDLGSGIDAVRTSITINCNNAGRANWEMAARFLAHFRNDGVMRKRKIKRLTQKLSSGQDLRDESIEQGVKTTLKKNLTDSNRSGLSEFQYFNSMGERDCSNPDFWLPEIQINPVIAFVNIKSSSSGADCIKSIGDNANKALPSDPASLDPILKMHWMTDPTNEYASSVGFEKNPWCVAYTGVNAVTRVRKPFSPGSGFVTLKARGFAKPFGGRIGPWYGKTWPNGADKSQAANRDEMVDPLLPSRGFSSPLRGNLDWANYSRYPGDLLGFTSAQALSAMIKSFNEKVNFPPPHFNINDVERPTFSWTNYDHLSGISKISATGDSLARDLMYPAYQRPFEIAAIAPDLFDAFYYSIEPTYYHNYFSDYLSKGGANFQDTEKIYDFGSTKDNNASLSLIGQNYSREYSIIDQVNLARELYHPSINWIIGTGNRDWKQLLTGWHQKASVDYSMDPQRFGKCPFPVPDDKQSQFPTTGSCIKGGRTGYSIKNVSMDFLCSEDHSLSGSGQKGPLLNPPPTAPNSRP